MTEYTPTTAEVMETFAECGAESEAEATTREESFWRWHTAIEAASEQRGAIKALREAAVLSRDCWAANKNLRDPDNPEASYSFDVWLEVRAGQYTKEENSDGR